jgi:hypothetical protein
VATQTAHDALEQAINDAHKLDLVDPETLREAVAPERRPGAATVRTVLDRFSPTDSPLEREHIGATVDFVSVRLT